MTDSILNSTKKLLGLDESYEAFDLDILTHINSVFSTLEELGVGPEDGYMIEDASALWADYLVADKKLNKVKSYMYLKVRMLFDPPTTSYQLDALKEQIREAEWRINVTVDNVVPVKSSEEPVVWIIDETEGFPDEAPEGAFGYDPNTGNSWRNYG